MTELEHHVHFDESKDDIKTNDIVVRARGSHSLEIQLGFLQIHHIYEITALLPNTVFTAQASKYVQRDNPVPNVNCRMTVLRDTPPSQVTIKLRYATRREKLVREKVVLEAGVGEEEGEVKLEVVARVLGKGKGTPSLREGIFCVGMEPDPDDTEASDWAGFD